MKSHSYIELKVANSLNKEDARKWLETVRANLPSGLPAETEIIRNGKPKTSSFYAKKHNKHICYIVPLARDPRFSEVQKVAVAWNKAQVDGDFEIDYSSAGTAAEIRKDVEDVGLREVAMEAAKLTHNRWLTEMTSLGWTYSTDYDSKNKRNPMMLPWEQLSSKYKAQELKRFESLLEVLKNLNLKLVRN